MHRRRMICAVLSPKNVHVTSAGLPLLFDLPIVAPAPSSAPAYAETPATLSRMESPPVLPPPPSPQQLHVAGRCSLNP